MADHDDLEFTSSKRARLSSDFYHEQENSLTKSLDQKEHKSVNLSNRTRPEDGVSRQSSPDHVSSREHHGRLVSHERLESEDFPTCFSVEDDLYEVEDHRYQPIAGPMGWVQRQMSLGVNPEDILSYMVPHAQLPSSLDKTTLWKIIIDILTEPSPRQKLDHINTLHDVVELLHGSKNIIVLTGAGVSVSCGIPDFRSRDGIYARLSVEYPDLPDPQAMFDISYFYQNPHPFFKFAKEIYPGQFNPSLSHRFIKQLQSNGQLLRNYSQNIDTLEQVAGISRVIQCHGSFSTASCTSCKYQVSSDAIKEDIFNQVIPLCPKCSQHETLAIMKPDIVFFGESLPSEFYHKLDEDSEKVDLLIVIGSSLKVRPVALIPSHIPPEVPQILINREPLRHMTFDVELLGDCDVIVADLCQRLGGTWSSLVEGYNVPALEKTSLYDEIPECGLESVELVDKETSKEVDNEQTPQKESHGGTCMLSIPEQLSNKKASCQVDTLRQQSYHTTVGETSSSEETGDESSRNQPNASASPQNSASNNEMPRFLFLPPSRYIFSGAEVMDSPLPSPSRNRPLYADSSSNDSDSVGEIEDEKTLSSGADGIDAYQLHRHSNEEGYSYDSGNSDDGFAEEEGDLEEADSDATKQAMSLILGELSSYTCESEENSCMSTSDELFAAASGAVCSNVPTGTEASGMSSASQPFSAVNMDVIPVKGGDESEREPTSPLKVDAISPSSHSNTSRKPLDESTQGADDTHDSLCTNV